MKVLDYTKADLKATNGIIIYGAGVWGKIVYETLKNLEGGEESKVVCFVDRYKTGEYLGKKIIQKESLKNFLEYDVLICAPSAFEDVCKILENIGFQTVYQVSNILAHSKMTSFTSWQERLPTEKLVEIYSYYKNRIDGKINRVVIPQLSVSVTEACSLKCKKCNALVPYYKTPKTFSFSEYITAMNCLLDTVDEIYEMGFIGGEAFLNKEFDQYIEWAVRSKKIDTVLIVTNATIIPNQKVINSLKHKKVILCLDDYGKLSEKLNEWIEIAEKECINYYILKNSYWYDFGIPVKKKYLQEEVQQIFDKCPIRDCNFFLKGKLYRCQYSGNLINLGFCKCEDECIDFNQITDKQKLRERVCDLIIRKKALESCNFCNCIDQCKLIPVAEQVSK